ncbi:hypothetical protein NECAME_17126 [Necator americanus]|uniref:SUEL-type lectin domain-containing protein n=1 Tax=Necator americanus TaxID=51031 RepID=W2TTX2_NECAM|nr:hypothetical protein NECAME_17126 [Necator americanus]ETN84502.1 hypothetical protein NECAME_17126 [Necator americanus]
MLRTLRSDRYLTFFGAGSIVVCEGGVAELACPRGTVISIALANYGRYSARVCYENEDLDDVVPMAQCHNPRTMPTLRKRADECIELLQIRLIMWRKKLATFRYQLT